MNEVQCMAFLEALRVKNLRPKGNGWIEGSCPLSPWTHKSHKDSSPSFGLSIVPGGRSHYLCFACRQGSAEELLHSIEMYSKGIGHYDFETCHQILGDEEYVVPLPEYGEFAQASPPFQEWPQYWLESFKPAEMVANAASYLTKRGVTIETVWKYGLRYDTKRQMVVAPYYDVYSRFAGARGRCIVPEEPYGHHDYTFQSMNNTRLVWFNEPVLNLHGPVVVVEGQFDCIKTAEAFPKTVAALTAKPTLEKMKKLGDCGLVIQIPDRDEAGEQSISRYAQLCYQFGLKHKVVRLDEGVKDPADCHVDYLKDKIAEVMG